MSDQPGWGQPDASGPDESPHSGQSPAPPPHPGWSPEQPGGQPSPPPTPPYSGPYPPAYPPQSQPAAYQQMPPPPGSWSHPGYSYGPPPAPKPGVIPLRPLSVGEILDGAIQSVRANPKIMLGLSALVVTTTQLLSFALTATFARNLETINPETATPGEVFGALGGLMGASGIAALVSALAQVILAGLLTVVVGRAVLGRSITLAEAWAQLRPRIWALIGASLLVLLLSVLGLFFCVLPGIWLYVMWWVATPAVVLERAGVITAMKRSWTLITGAFWRTFLIVLLTVILTVVISSIVAMPFQMLSGFGAFTAGPDQLGMITTTSLLASTLGSIIGGTLTYPFTAAVTVLVYVDRRMRLEGLDLELARAAGVPPRQ